MCESYDYIVIVIIPSVGLHVTLFFNNFCSLLIPYGLLQAHGKSVLNCRPNNINSIPKPIHDIGFRLHGYAWTGGGDLAEKTKFIKLKPFDLFPYKSDVSYCTNSDYNKKKNTVQPRKGPL